MVGREGLEPSTNRLKAYCSTIEPTAQNRAKYLNRSRHHTQAESPRPLKLPQKQQPGRHSISQPASPSWRLASIYSDSSSSCASVARSRFCCRRSEEHTSELQTRGQLVCRLLLEKKQAINNNTQLEVIT